MTNEILINPESIQFILNDASLSDEVKRIGEKVIAAERISPEEGLYLYEHGSLGLLGALANFIREKKNGERGGATDFRIRFHSILFH